MSAPALEERAQPLRPAASPTGSGPVAVVGPVLALLTGALGAVLVRDAVVAARGTGTAWLGTATDALVGARPAGWLVPAGLVVALLGLWLVVTALRRRTRDSLPLGGRAGAHLRTRDVARLATGAAEGVDGVLDASSTATRRRVRVSVTTTGAAGTADAVSAAVAGALSAVTRPPRVLVRDTTPRDRKETR
ncbi:DUF6286 domain-containing protein [Kineococcus gypseus]|uniref:DUF6286 domain-containing protein n=1 Tax=Kineococcus gypseus TaxID=1637102 RepID=UPI003D7E1150